MSERSASRAYRVIAPPLRSPAALRPCPRCRLPPDRTAAA